MHTNILRALAAVACLGLTAPEQAAAQDGGSLFGMDTASVTYGRYVRLELGLANPNPDGGTWLPPGPGDPRIYFDLSGENTGYGAVAYGFDWMDGIRADVALTFFGNTDLTSPEGETIPPDTEQHAEITDASVRTTAVMANLFFSPMEAQGSNSRFQPFVVGGLGLARNQMGSWERTNTDSGRETRRFEGNTSNALAVSLGLGASYQVTRAGQRPVIVEAAWRYYHLGRAKGSPVPFPGDGQAQPREALNFANEQSVFTLGVRIPLQRF